MGEECNCPPGRFVYEVIPADIGSTIGAATENIAQKFGLTVEQVNASPAFRWYMELYEPYLETDRYYAPGNLLWLPGTPPPMYLSPCASAGLGILDISLFVQLLSIIDYAELLAPNGDEWQNTLVDAQLRAEVAYELYYSVKDGDLEYPYAQVAYDYLGVWSDSAADTAYTTAQADPTHPWHSLDINLMFEWLGEIRTWWTLVGNVDYSDQIFDNMYSLNFAPRVNEYQTRADAAEEQQERLAKMQREFRPLIAFWARNHKKLEADCLSALITNINKMNNLLAGVWVGGIRDGFLSYHGNMQTRYTLLEQLETMLNAMHFENLSDEDKVRYERMQLILRRFDELGVPHTCFLNFGFSNLALVEGCAMNALKELWERADGGDEEAIRIRELLRTETINAERGAAAVRGNYQPRPIESAEDAFRRIRPSSTEQLINTATQTVGALWFALSFVPLIGQITDFVDTVIALARGDVIGVVINFMPFDELFTPILNGVRRLLDTAWRICADILDQIAEGIDAIWSWSGKTYRQIIQYLQDIFSQIDEFLFGQAEDNYGELARETGSSNFVFMSSTKPVNLPSSRRTDVDIVHIVDRHTTTGATYNQSGIKNAFPEGWTAEEIERAIREAYSNGKRIRTQGERVVVHGESRGLTIEIWVNIETKIIETAYPVD